jgi:hypothetical protein
MGSDKVTALDRLTRLDKKLNLTRDEHFSFRPCHDTSEPGSENRDRHHVQLQQRQAGLQDDREETSG